MGLIIYPVYRTPVLATQTLTTGEFVAAEIESLEEIAAGHGLTPLGAFADQREVPADFDGPPENLDDILGPCEDWFSPQHGSRALLALATLIRNRPEVAQRLAAPDAVVEELEDLARQLAIAARAGTQFRLGIS